MTKTEVALNKHLKEQEEISKSYSRILKLDEGNILLLYNEKYNSFEVSANVNGGGLDGEPGVAHFLEHMLCPEIGKVEFFNNNSIDYNANTALFDTRYFTVGKGMYLEDLEDEKNEALNSSKTISKIMTFLDEYFYWWKLFRRISNGTATEVEKSVVERKLEKEKGIILSEYYSYQGNDYKDKLVALKAMAEPQYRDNLRQIIGEKEDIENMSLEKLIKFYRRYYNRKYATINISLPVDVLKLPDYHKLELRLSNLFKHELSDTEAVKYNLEEKIDNIRYERHKNEDFEIKEEGNSSVLLTFDLPFVTDRTNHDLHKDDTKCLMIHPDLHWLLNDSTVEIFRHQLMNELTTWLRDEGIIYWLAEYRNRRFETYSPNTQLTVRIYTKDHDKVISSVKYIIDKFEAKWEHLVTDAIEDAKNINTKKNMDAFLRSIEHSEIYRYNKLFKFGNFTDEFFDIYKYIKQIEEEINNGEESSILSLYKEIVSKFKELNKEFRIVKFYYKGESNENTEGDSI